MTRTLHPAVLAALVALLPGCGCNGNHAIKRPYPAPGVADVLAHLEATRTAATSFRAESVMDYWVGKQRVRGTVLVMGKVGARMRFNALNPTGGNVAADLACDGVDFAFIDYNDNCQLVGPCTGRSIAQLLRVDLEPDDFLLLAVGSTPVLPGAEGTLTWDSEHGYEVLELTSGATGYSQKIVIDGRRGRDRWAVIESLVRDEHGNTEWHLENKDFSLLTADDGTVLVVPGKTRFRQPKEKADLIVDWKKREVNLPLGDDKWQIEIPVGLRSCGEK